MRWVKTTFLSEVNQFLLTKETVTDSWRILRHVTLGHRRCRAQLKFWFGQNCIDMISHRIFPRTTQGYKGDLNAKVNQKAPGKMRCKFIMETIEFFKSKTKKIETERVFPNPESTQWNSMICWQGKVLFIEKFWQAFCWQLWKPSPAPHHEEVTCHSGAISFVEQLDFNIILSYTLIPH